MSPLSPQQQRRVDGIISIVKEFLDARYEHAVRVNPSIGHVYGDLSWQQLVTLRQIIGQTKAFGPVRFYVCDILASDDEEKKKALFLPTDQNTLMNEIVNLADDTTDTRHGVLGVRDMRSFYRALDPSLEQIVELIQTWIWWDLPDASDLYTFDHDYQRVVKLAKQSINEKIVEYYRKLMKRHSDDEPGKAEILEFEIEKLEEIRKRFRRRREEEGGYQMILKREEKSSKAFEDMALSLAGHIEKLNKIESLDELTDDLRKEYAKKFQMSPSDITKNMALEYEKQGVKNLQDKLKESLNMGRTLGEPFDLKLRKLHEIEQRLAKLKKTLFPEKKKEPAPSAASSE